MVLIFKSNLLVFWIFNIVVNKYWFSNILIANKNFLNILTHKIKTSILSNILNNMIIIFFRGLNLKNGFLTVLWKFIKIFWSANRAVDDAYYFVDLGVGKLDPIFIIDVEVFKILDKVFVVLIPSIVGFIIDLFIFNIKLFSFLFNLISLN